MRNASDARSLTMISTLSGSTREIYLHPVVLGHGKPTRPPLRLLTNDRIGEGEISTHCASATTHRKRINSDTHIE
jgi:hypothetical protein